MSEKKLFPGVTQQSIQRQEIKKQKAEEIAQAKQAAIQAAKEKAEKEAKAKEEQKKLHSLYNGNILPFKLKVGLIAVLNLCIGELHRSINDYDEQIWHHVDPIENNTLGQAIAEAYVPTYHAPYEHGRKGHFESTPNPRWMMHMIVLLAEALVLSLLAINNAKRNKQIDLMAEIARISKEQNIDPQYIKKMLKVAPDIIKNMSKDSRVYFDMLIEGKLDTEKAPAFLDMATSIMEGHLQTHPEDLQVIMNLFDERSIPESIKQMANTQAR